MNKKKVIFVTDGDEHAVAAVKLAADSLSCYFLSQSAGNPTIESTKGLLKKVQEAPIEPIIILFDDAGWLGEGPGEKRMMEIAKTEFVEIIGVVAVAAHSFVDDWTKVHVSIDRNGEITEYGVDKEGIKETEIGRIRGDTVDCLNINEVPLIIGVGDIGKMGGYDSVKCGSPITKQAIQLILERSGLRG